MFISSLAHSYTRPCFYLMWKMFHFTSYSSRSQIGAKRSLKQRRCADSKKRGASLQKANMSRHVPSSTEETVAIRSQFLFSKPLRCTPRPAALTSMSAEEEQQQWLQESRRAPCHMQPTRLRDGGALLCCEGCGHQTLQTAALPPPQVSNPSFSITGHLVGSFFTALNVR